MFTTGSKFFFGLAAAAIGAGALYWLSTNLEFFGVIVLLSLATVAAFLGGVIIAFRDADVGTPAVESASAADAEGVGSKRPIISPSVWPLVGGFGAALCVIGVVYDRRFFVGGLLVLAAVTVEWAVQGWADRASDDAAYNARVRARLMHPLEFPIAGVLTVGLVIYGFSRVMLAIPEGAAVAAFIGLGAVILVVAAVRSLRPRVPRALMAVVLLVGGVGVLAGGIAGAVSGERTVESPGGPEGNDKTSNAVADKSALAAALTVSDTGFSQDAFTIPRSLPVNILFQNNDNAPRNLVIEAGEEVATDENGQEVKDAQGNVVMRKITFRTDFIGHGKAVVLNVRMPKPGSFTFRSDGGTTGTITGTVRVP
jgi:hypothetical protein